MFTIAKIDASRLEGHGSGKDVAIRRHRQQYRVVGKAAVYIGEELIALGGVVVPDLRQLRQHGQHRPGRAGDLFLLSGQAADQKDGMGASLLDGA